MPLDIGEAIQGGIERTVARNGLYFVVITFVLDTLGALASTPMTRDAMMVGTQFGGGVTVQPRVPSLGLSPTVAGLLSLVVGLVSLVVFLAALRTFVTEETETIPGEHFSRNLLVAAVNLIVGGVVFGVVVAVGFVFLVIPGLFLLVSLLFWAVYVAVEDENFVAAFRSSWGLTRGHRLRLFAIGVLVVVISAIVGAIFAAPRGFLPLSIGFLIAQVGSALTGVFTIATIARTYDQLVALEDEDEDEGGHGAEGDGPDGDTDGVGEGERDGGPAADGGQGFEFGDDADR